MRTRRNTIDEARTNLVRTLKGIGLSDDHVVKTLELADTVKNEAGDNPGLVFMRRTVTVRTVTSEASMEAVLAVIAYLDPEPSLGVPEESASAEQILRYNDLVVEWELRQNEMAQFLQSVVAKAEARIVEANAEDAAKAEAERKAKQKEVTEKYGQLLAEVARKGRETWGEEVPQPSPTYRWLGMSRMVANAVAYSLVAHKQPFYVLATGEKGAGKTAVCEQIAAHLGLGYVKLDCGSTQSAPDTWGNVRVDSSGEKYLIEWKPSPFTEAFTKGNVIICFDEFTRLPPVVQNALLPLLDGSKTIIVEGAPHPLRVGPNVVFMATANQGAKYRGVGPVDAALVDRFAIHWEAETPTAQEMFEIVMSNLGRTASAPENPLDYTFQATGITDGQVQMIAKVCKALEDATKDPSSPVSDYPSIRAALSTCRLIETGGMDMVEVGLVNRYPGNSIGGSASQRDAVRAVIAKTVEDMIAESNTQK